MELKDLINGTYWLVTAKGLTVTDYYIIHKIKQILLMILSKSLIFYY